MISQKVKMRNQHVDEIRRKKSEMEEEFYKSMTELKRQLWKQDKSK